jgi:hypothetical protein
MNKNQALAVMDAHMVPVAAERQRRLQKRQRLMLGLYPVLKRAPPEERGELLEEARRYAVRQWSVYAALGLVLAAATYLLRGQIFGVVPEVPTPRFLLLIAMAAVPGAVLYAQIRGYLSLLVGTRYAPTEIC